MQEIEMRNDEYMLALAEIENALNSENKELSGSAALVAKVKGMRIEYKLNGIDNWHEYKNNPELVGTKSFYAPNRTFRLMVA